MTTIVVTGAKGFIGKNLVAWLSTRSDLTILSLDIDDSAQTFANFLERADFVFHLAGTNRPKNPEEFKNGNTDLTQSILSKLKETGRRIPILLSSSIQAALDNPYGISKNEAEKAVARYAEATGSLVYIFRLPNVFGKWCRPNYNSVVATFCHNVANGLPLHLSNPEQELQLVHIDAVITAFLEAWEGNCQPDAGGICSVPESYQIRLKELSDRISSFPASRVNKYLPGFEDKLTRLLYSTYLTYLPEDAFSYPLEMKTDPRGWLAEFIRTPNAGQIFISVTKPGITRGNHWHHTKTEKFLVVQGNAIIRFRRIDGEHVIEYPVSGGHLQVVDIPPGYSHAITNLGDTDVITLFWASEAFDPSHPDTFGLNV